METHPILRKTLRKGSIDMSGAWAPYSRKVVALRYNIGGVKLWGTILPECDARETGIKAIYCIWVSNDLTCS